MECTKNLAYYKMWGLLSILRDWLYEPTEARPDIKVELWPAACNNLSRKPTYYLQQTIQGDNNLYNSWPQMARIWLVTGSFLNFWLCVQFRMNQRMSNMYPFLITWDAPLLVSLPPVPAGQQPPSGHVHGLSFLPTLKPSPSSPCLQVSRKCKWGWLTSLWGKSE